MLWDVNFVAPSIIIVTESIFLSISRSCSGDIYYDAHPFFLQTTNQSERRISVIPWRFALWRPNVNFSGESLKVILGIKILYLWVDHTILQIINHMIMVMLMMMITYYSVQCGEATFLKKPSATAQHPSSQGS